MSHHRRTLTAALLLVLSASLLDACGTVPAATPTSVPTQPPPAPTSTPPPFPKTVDLLGELEIEGGAVRSLEECDGALGGMEGGIILGLDPQTCEVVFAGTASASLRLNVPPAYADQVFVLKISWPKENGRGLRSFHRPQTARLYLDDAPIWAKTSVGASPVDGRVYYAAQAEPVLLTFLPGQAGVHTLKIVLPPGMLWDIGSLELSTAPRPANILGIAYSPYRDCQSAETLAQPAVEDIREDLSLWVESATAVRIYSSTGVNALIPQLAAEMGIPVYAGAWLDGDPQKDQEEIDGLLAIVGRSPVEAAIVGNEYSLRHGEPQDLDYLLARIRQFKQARPDIPVTTAEIDSYIFDWSKDGVPTVKPGYEPILDEIDLLVVHIYPFWSYRPAQGAAAWTIERFQAIEALMDERYGGSKRVIVGEAGWPAAGQPGHGYGDVGESSPGDPGRVFHPELQRQYMLELLRLARQHGVDLFLFGAFDELWKTEGTDGAGRTWGLYYADRTARYNLASLLVPPELMPSAAEGDTYSRYRESDFAWEAGAFPVYTEWPAEPKARPEALPALEPYTLHYTGDEPGLDLFACERNSHSGETALRIRYTPGGGSRGWSGAQWAYVEEDSSPRAQGSDLSASQTLTFWARGEAGSEVVEFTAGGACGEYDGQNPPPCPDSLQPRVSSGPILLGSAWRQYALDLTGLDLSNVVSAFSFSVSRIHNPGGATFYLDDIAFSPYDPALYANVYPRPAGSTFSVYSEYAALDNHFIPSNFMGDGETPGYLYLNQGWQEWPRSGTTSIRVEYLRGPLGWAGVYWTDPENNWGQRPGGYDLSGASRLSFWARSDVPGQQLKVLIGGIGCFRRQFPYADSVCDAVPVPWVTLTPGWQQYTVDLSAVTRDWSRVLGGFGFVVTRPGTFYLDDILYEMDGE